MKTRKEIATRIAEITLDKRYHYPLATIHENAPLALVQLSLETEIRALAWVLGALPPRPKKGKL